MSEPLRVLLVDDSEDDAELVARALDRGGLPVAYERVETAAAMRDALARAPWDVVIADYVMPSFGGVEALGLVREAGLDVPFILVSGAVPDETAIATMRAGCHDYVCKQALARLAPAVRRELHEAGLRQERRQALAALRFMADASAVAAASFSDPGALGRAARLAVPSIADGCTLDVVDDGGRVQRLAVAHVDPAKAPILAGLPVLPRGAPLLLPEITEDALASGAVDRATAATLRALGARSAIFAPLVLHGRSLGAVSLVSDASGRRYGASDLEVTEALALRCALAIENTRLFHEAQAAARSAEAALAQQREAHAAAEQAEQRTAFLAEAGRVLGCVLDYEGTLRAAAGLAVPAVADACVLTLADGDRLRIAAVAAAEGSAGGPSPATGHDLALDPESPSGAPRVIRTGRPELVPDARALGPAAERAILGAAPLRSYLCAPLVARGSILGALSFATTGSQRVYGADDLLLAEEIARRVGVAIDNATLYRKAQEAIRLRDDFLQVASHELLTPLTSLKLQVQSRLRRPGASASSPDALREALIDRQIDRLSALVGDLLDVSCLVAGRIELAREPVDLAALARDVVARFAVVARRASAALSLSAPEAVVGLWDRGRLEQVLLNLLSNAVKFGAGAPIQVTVESDDAEARLSVRDHGIGIDARDVDRIFGRLERAVSADHYGGLGLGLYITRGIVEAQHGAIRVESSPGAGATFTVALPRAPGP